jgi:transcriptional repressor NrdR
VIENLILEVERHFSEAAEREIEAAEIGHHLLRVLRSVDEVAYVRFASVYHEFSDVNQFLEALVALQVESRESGRG